MIEGIGSLVRQAEQNYINGTTTLSKYVEFDQYENINKIDAYLNSKHTTGKEDSKGRLKPFFNIVTAAVNIWYRATNIAQSMIRIKPTKLEHFVLAFLATLHVQEWMKSNAFEQFLDDWGRTLAKYGSALVKFAEKGGDLVATVVPWNRLICDTIEFEGNLVIEKLELTPSQLRKSGYDQQAVEDLIEARDSRESLDGQKRDNKDDYITLYELHGELPLAYLTDSENDEDTYVQQMHVVSFVSTSNSGSNSREYLDFTLYKGKEKNPYLMTHLIKEDGRTMGIGAVENLFDAQWMTNHSQKLIKDQLDLASQLIFQTADAAFVGRNILTDIMTGDILVHEENKPLTQLANRSHDITALQNFGAEWRVLSKDITSTPDAIRGNTMPSGTAFRQVAILNKEASSLFEVMTRNKKRALEEMLRKFVIPHIKRKMDTTEEIAATLESQDIDKLDDMFVPKEAIRRENERIKREVLSGQIATNQDIAAVQQEVRGELEALGNQRFIKPSSVGSKTWKQVLNNLEWEADIEIRDKDVDKQLVAQNLIDIFKTMADPAVQQFISTPNGKTIFNKILESSSALSPLELGAMPTMQAQPQLQEDQLQSLTQGQ